MDENKNSLVQELNNDDNIDQKDPRLIIYFFKGFLLNLNF